MIKKTLLSIIMLTLVILLGNVSVFQVEASARPQEQTPHQFQAEGNSSYETFSPENESVNDNIVLLESLGVKSDKVLKGPFSQFELEFSIPADWQLLPGAMLELKISHLISSVMLAQGEQAMSGMLSGVLSVNINGHVVNTSILQGNGDQTILVEIPVEVFMDIPVSGTNKLVVEWDASSACDFNLASSVTLHPNSRLILPHNSGQVPVDISLFPWPFYLKNSAQNASVKIIIKNEPLEEELAAAMSVAAGLGRLSQGNLNLDILTEKDLSDEIKKHNHLIVIGNPGDFPFLAGVVVPDFDGYSENSGFIWMVSSPWNQARLILGVSGKTENMMLTAGKVLSTGNLISANEKNNLVVVEDGNITSQAIEPVEDIKFSDLKQGDLTFKRLGSQNAYIPFNIPVGTYISPEAYVDITFNHSQLLDYLRSGIVIRVNGTAVGSMRLGDNTANLYTSHLVLPSTALIQGINILEIQVEIASRNICTDPRQGSLWVTIFSNSLIHLPRTNQSLPNMSIQSIGDYPQSFINDGTLANLVFILPEGFPPAWGIAGKIAYDLGSRTNGKMSAPGVVLGAFIESQDETGKNIIVISPPSKVPPEISKYFPIPFEGDRPSAKAVGGLKLMIPDGNTVGFIESSRILMENQNVVLALMGMTEHGLKNALEALTNPAQRAKLAMGNFAVVQGKKVLVEDVITNENNRMSAPESEVKPSSETYEVTGARTVPSSGRLAWIMPVLLASIFLALLIIGYKIVMKYRTH